MECSIKKMSSYQVLKKELESQIMATKEARWIGEVCKEALWKITQLKDPELVKAPKIALKALAKLNETKETQD